MDRLNLSINRALNLKAAASEAETDWLVHKRYRPQDILGGTQKLLRCRRLWLLTEKAWYLSKKLIDKEIIDL